MDEIYKLLTIVGAAIGATMTLGIWLSGQFTKINNSIISTYEKVLSKLEYHERHDDARFETVRKDLWEMRVGNARLGLVDGKTQEDRS